MFSKGKFHIIRAEFFTHVKFVRLTDGAFRFLIALIDHTDDAGNVDLNMEEFREIARLSIDELTVDDYKVRLEELIQVGHISPYYVQGRRYGQMVGWNDKKSPMYQSIPVSMRSEWRNPTPEEADEHQVLVAEAHRTRPIRKAPQVHAEPRKAHSPSPPRQSRIKKRPSGSQSGFDPAQYVDMSSLQLIQMGFTGEQKAAIRRYQLAHMD